MIINTSSTSMKREGEPVKGKAQCNSIAQGYMGACNAMCVEMTIVCRRMFV